jgi:DNA-binding IclR family transcriptional regulator
VIAALSITGPSSRLSKRRLLELIAPAARTAYQVSANLGYGGEEPTAAIRIPV